MPQEFFNLFRKAIVNCDIETVQNYIDEANNKGYHLNQNDPKTTFTLLHFAITKATKHNEDQMIQIIDLLHISGIDVNRPTIDDFHFVPLHTAARRLLPNIVKWLLDHGADRTIKDIKDTKPYQTALDYIEILLNAPTDNKDRLEEMVDILETYAISPNEPNFPWGLCHIL
ncbi:MAG: ankyrin repeat domain-containing protein [Legionella longbeachae]|nr:ankyrin repeat domain-containing protein [Legionella longbeachae]